MPDMNALFTAFKRCKEKILRPIWLFEKEKGIVNYYPVLQSSAV